jgi:basic amino acid/polyamine antiporter, APA family
MAASQSSVGLRRQIGLRSAIALVVGEVIAVGIFLTPAQMAKSLGSPFWLLIVWLVMGAMALSGAFCYGELAARFPEAGGGYVYLREVYGPAPAFLYGWKSLLVMDPGLTAALATGMATYVVYIGGLPPVSTKPVAICAIISLAAANATGVRVGAFLMRWLAFLKVGLLLLIIIWAFGFRLGSWSNFLPFVAQRPGSTTLAGAIGVAMVAGFFSFGGWWDLSKLGGEVKNPGTTLPRALAWGVGAVTFLYVLTSAAFVYLVPIERADSGETFAAQAGEALFGRAGGLIFATVVLVSILGSLAVVIMVSPRVYYAMARDGVFFPAIARIHPRFGTPSRSIALQAALACVIVWLGSFDEIISYFIFVAVLFIALTVAAVFMQTDERPDGMEHKVPGYPVTPILFLVLVVPLLVLLAANNLKQAILGLLVVGLGVPVYYLFFRRASGE